MMARFAFVLDQFIDVGRDLDLLAAIVKALMLGHDVGAIENAHPVWIGPHGERAPRTYARPYRSNRSCRSSGAPMHMSASAHLARGSGSSRQRQAVMDQITLFQ